MVAEVCGSPHETQTKIMIPAGVCTQAEAGRGSRQTFFFDGLLQEQGEQLVHCQEQFVQYVVFAMLPLFINVDELQIFKHQFWFQVEKKHFVCLCS